ncbi:zinc finger protein 691-like [Anopheles bellator]|uniref:zinc finger protein 691-like n=1 Tax=Anopheles bellator TaxID=139047 RepID=UPI002647035C|nr:zinc finger protein 691-like [Anopheles bellator]
MAEPCSFESNADPADQDELQYCVANFNHLCRLCLSNDRLVSIFSNVQGRNVYYVRHYVKFALDLLAIKINKHDTMPNFLCERCERNLYIIAKFKKKCDDSLRILRCVSGSIKAANKVEDSMVTDTTGRNRQRKRKYMKTKSPAAQQQEYIDILQKLPQGINVAKIKKDSTIDVVKEDKKNNQASNEPACNKQFHSSIEVHVLKEEVLPESEEQQEQHLIERPFDDLGDSDLGEFEQDDNWVPMVPGDTGTYRQESSAYHEDQTIALEEEEVVERDYEEVKLEWEQCEPTRKYSTRRTTREREEAEGVKASKAKIVCSVCGSMVNNIKTHMAIHSEVRPHQCEQCPKSFTSRHKLQSHTNSVHLRRRDFKCEVCGKAFLEKNNLKGHLRIHIGERKYRCDLCPKTFLFAGTLRCHKLTHTQEKTHACQVCGKLFLMRTTLNKHLRVHNDERPHRCDVCDKRFRTATHKVVHMRTHTGEKPLVCRICGMGFAQHKARSVHMKTKHLDQLMALNLIDEKGHLKV